MPPPQPKVLCVLVLFSFLSYIVSILRSVERRYHFIYFILWSFVKLKTHVFNKEVKICPVLIVINSKFIFLFLTMYLLGTNENPIHII